jgi:hypothetical protein
MKTRLFFSLLFSAALAVSACDAITTAGTQCKRKPLPGSTYCYQHQAKTGKTIVTTQAQRVQCAAICKSGKQCSRSAANGSAYCWQHQPSTDTTNAKGTK